MVKKILISVLFCLYLSSVSCGDILRAYFFNVGEGEATLLKTEKATVLIDAGNLISGFSLFQKLKKLGVSKIDALVITHPHLDHMGGVFYVLQLFDVRAKFDNGERLYMKRDVYRWYSEIFRNGNYKALKSGDVLKFGALKIEVLSPSHLRENWNDNSLVLRVSFHNITFLFMADVSYRVEEKLLKSEQSLYAQLLKVGHHGAEDATSVKFLKAVSPKISIIFAARHHFHGYPSWKVVKRIKCSGSLLFITGYNGDILVKTNGSDLIFRRVDNLP